MTDTTTSIGLTPQIMLRYPQCSGDTVNRTDWGSLIRVLESNDQRLQLMIKSLTVDSTVSSAVGAGTVTSVGLTLNSNLNTFLSVTSPAVSVAGNLTLSFVSGAGNTFLRGDGSWVSVSADSLNPQTINTSVLNVAATASAKMLSAVTVSASVGYFNNITSSFTSVNSAIASVSSLVATNSTALVSVNSVITSLATSYKTFWTDFNERLIFSLWYGNPINAGSYSFIHLANAQASVETQAGILSFNASSSTTNSGYYHLSNTRTAPFRGGESTNFYINFRYPTSTVCLLGFLDENSTDPQGNGAYFNITNGAVVAVATSSSVNTSVGLITITASTWYQFKISVSPVSASTVMFQIYDSAASVLASANITSNIPVSPAQCFGHGALAYMPVAVSTFRAFLYLDYMDLTLPSLTGTRGTITPKY